MGFGWQARGFGRHSRLGRLQRFARVACAATVAASTLLFGLLAVPAPAAAAVVREGGVVAWGSNASGQLDVPEDARTGVIGVAAGCSHSLALRADGRVVAWGDDTYGQTDVPAAAQSKVLFISAGCVHNLALRSDGKLVAWGDDSYGQRDVPELSGRTWVNFGAGARHSIGVLENRIQVGVWGDNSQNQLVMPAALMGLGSTIVRQVEAGGDNSIARLSNGSVVVWGAGPPSVLAVPYGLRDVSDVSMGYEHVLALRAHGRVFAWGDNTKGQIDVPDGLTAIAISAGREHSLALRADWRIVAWGSNEFGQVTVPPLPAHGRYIAIAAGGRHSLAGVPAPPDAPTDVVATALDGAATVTWKPSAHNGGYGVRSYQVTSTPEGKTCSTTGETSCTIEGLANGTQYTFTVTATNAMGPGLPSAASAMVGPAAPTPTPAAPVTARPSASPNGSAPVSPAPASEPPLPLAFLAAAGLAIFAVGLGAAAVAYRARRS